MNKNFDKFINTGKYIGATVLGIAGNTAVLNYFGDTTVGIAAVAGLSGGAIGAAAGYLAGSAIGGSVGLLAKNKNSIKNEKFILAGIACVSTALVASNHIAPNIAFIVCLYSFAKLNTLSAYLIEKSIEKTEDAIIGVGSITIEKTQSMINKIRGKSGFDVIPNEKNKIIIR